MDIRAVVIDWYVCTLFGSLLLLCFSYSIRLIYRFVQIYTHTHTKRLTLFCIIGDPKVVGVLRLWKWREGRIENGKQQRETQRAQHVER